MTKIYAFYGTGKTTLAEKFPHVYFDDDRFVPESKYAGQPVVLTNHPDDDCAIYVLPANLDEHKKKLVSKLSFFAEYGDDFLEKEYARVAQKENVIFTDEILETVLGKMT